MDEEMMKALQEDGEKLTAMTGEDHGPQFLHEWTCAKCFEWNIHHKLECTACGHVIPQVSEVD